jgi:hypothetical protein
MREQLRRPNGAQAQEQRMIATRRGPASVPDAYPPRPLVTNHSRLMSSRWLHSDVEGAARPRRRQIGHSASIGNGPTERKLDAVALRPR